MDTWKEHDKTLVLGDIIRCKITNKEHPNFGEYIYSICKGSGFGCTTFTSGNAIIVVGQCFDLDEIKKKKVEHKGELESLQTDRWERFWGIEYLVESDSE